ncbi:MAG: hypothetical protein AAF333_17675 [Planctomycetota bacterium]
MSDQEFQTYLDELCEKLNLSTKQREAIAGELRDHMASRLEDLHPAAQDRDVVIRGALEDFGDADQLARRFRHAAPISPKKVRLTMQRKRLVALSSAALVLLSVAVYRVAWTPEPSAPDIADQPAATLPAAEESTAATNPPQCLVETTILDADERFWEALVQLSGADPDAHRDVLILPRGLARPLVYQPTMRDRTARLAAPNIAVLFGQPAELFVGREETGSGQDIRHESGVGLKMTPWWNSDHRQVELAVTFFTERSFHEQTRQPAAAAVPVPSGARLESLSARAWLGHDHTLAIRTPLTFPDHPARHARRVVLIDATALVTPDGEHPLDAEESFTALPAHVTTHQELTAFLDHRWANVLREGSRLSKADYEASLRTQLDQRIETFSPLAQLSPTR